MIREDVDEMVKKKVLIWSSCFLVIVLLCISVTWCGYQYYRITVHQPIHLAMQESIEDREASNDSDEIDERNEIGRAHV